ncbi:GNAT family N-acetyltransferase [Chengkuizengella axinellae]|uniref:GNAT family N-acetyltransferase n=1 Tax=Chengkuizengella axinellae TaxID=3064388 RepID=A0ABT9IZP5_9BACL|nr:GNAT family N-acetyltransferase [Chengkuizengella sp. 2205SS18-9]MDP5274245.1 GNAT family N-acetyltransferase [Chengkuizengella sp. 2205SS18-9]
MKNYEIAEDDGKIVGYCLGFDHYTFYANGRVSWVEEIMVEESYRNKGIGAKLMNSVEEWSETRESKLVALATRRAVPFYKALDYVESASYFRKLL